MRLAELTDDDGAAVLVNPEHVTLIEPRYQHRGSQIYFTGEHKFIRVRETPNEVRTRFGAVTA